MLAVLACLGAEAWGCQEVSLTRQTSWGGAVDRCCAFGICVLFGRFGAEHDRIPLDLVWFSSFTSGMLLSVSKRTRGFHAPPPVLRGAKETHNPLKIRVSMFLKRETDGMASVSLFRRGSMAKGGH